MDVRLSFVSQSEAFLFIYFLLFYKLICLASCEAADDDEYDDDDDDDEVDRPFREAAESSRFYHNDLDDDYDDDDISVVDRKYSRDVLNLK